MHSSSPRKISEICFFKSTSDCKTSAQQQTLLPLVLPTTIIRLESNAEMRGHAADFVRTVLLCFSNPSTYFLSLLQSSTHSISLRPNFFAFKILIRCSFVHTHGPARFRLRSVAPLESHTNGSGLRGHSLDPGLLQKCHSGGFLPHISLLHCNIEMEKYDILSSVCGTSLVTAVFPTP